MRQSKMLATKDHFILIASSNKVGTELWSGYSEEFNVQTANTLGFLCTGEVSAFLRANNTWNAYTTVEAPFLMVRPHFGNLGIAAKQESTRLVVSAFCRSNTACKPGSSAPSGPPCSR